LEVTKKNKELVEKIEELNDLKNNYEDALAKLGCLEQKFLQKLQNEFD